MTMLKVLAKVIRAIELLRVIALAELVHGRQVLEASVPVWPREIRELFAAVPARIVGGTRAGLAGWRGGAVEGGLEAWECGAGPGVAAEVEGVLVTLCFVFVFEAVVAVLAGILLFHLVRPVRVSFSICSW